MHSHERRQFGANASQPRQVGTKLVTLPSWVRAKEEILLA